VPVADYKNLHVFPVGIRHKGRIPVAILKRQLMKLGIDNLLKFPDCPWSRNQYVLFLPLGFHVGYNEIDEICRLLLAFSCDSL
jgi:hypothetical protein